MVNCEYSLKTFKHTLNTFPQYFFLIFLQILGVSVFSKLNDKGDIDMMLQDRSLFFLTCTGVAFIDHVVHADLDLVFIMRFDYE